MVRSRRSLGTIDGDFIRKTPVRGVKGRQSPAGTRVGRRIANRGSAVAQSGRTLAPRPPTKARDRQRNGQHDGPARGDVGAAQPSWQRLPPGWGLSGVIAGSAESTPGDATRSCRRSVPPALFIQLDQEAVGQFGRVAYIASRAWLTCAPAAAGAAP